MTTDTKSDNSANREIQREAASPYAAPDAYDKDFDTAHYRAEAEALTDTEADEENAYNIHINEYEEENMTNSNNNESENMTDPAPIEASLLRGMSNRGALENYTVRTFIDAANRATEEGRHADAARYLDHAGRLMADLTSVVGDLHPVAFGTFEAYASGTGGAFAGHYSECGRCGHDTPASGPDTTVTVAGMKMTVPTVPTCPGCGAVRDHRRYGNSAEGYAWAAPEAPEAAPIGTEEAPAFFAE